MNPARQPEKASAGAPESEPAAPSRLLRRLRGNGRADSGGQLGLWILAAIAIILVALIPIIGEFSTLVRAQQAIYLGLLALSLNLLVNTTGLVSFGHAMFFAFGAYMVAIPAQTLEWSPLLGLAFVPLVAAIAALILGLVVLRGAELYFALLTLGVGQLVWAVAHGWRSLTGGTGGTTGVFGPDLINPFLNQNNLYWFIFGVAGIATLILLVITRSPFGDALRAIRENRLKAEFTGLAVKRYELASFVIAGIFGAVAGGLFVIGETQISSGQVNWTRSAIALIVALIGGMRYFLGPFAGAFFYIFVFDYIIARTVLWDTVLGIIVLFVALALPGGLVGLLHKASSLGESWIRGRRTDEGVAPRGPAPDDEVVHIPSAVRSDVVPLAAADSSSHAQAGREERSIVLDVRGVTKRFGGLVATNDVSLSVRQGTIHAIIGPNGAGKTTLFNLITCLASPDEGTIVLAGEDVTGTAPWRLVKQGVGRSFQQASLFWELSVLTNVMVADAAARGATRKAFGSHPPEFRDRAMGILERVGLAAFADLPASSLSHGDQRSLEIATALAVESQLLLLDEPTAGLSPAETATTVALIRQLAREQDLTVLFVEHDMEVVFGIADRVTVLDRGAVLAEGSPEEVRSNPAVRRAYLGEPEEAEAT